MESSDVAKFRQCVLDGAWDSADEVLMRLGFVDDEALWVCFLPSRCVSNAHCCAERKVPDQSAEIPRDARGTQDCSSAAHPTRGAGSAQYGAGPATFTIKVSLFVSCINTTADSPPHQSIDVPRLRRATATGRVGWHSWHIQKEASGELTECVPQ